MALKALTHGKEYQVGVCDATQYKSHQIVMELYNSIQAFENNLTLNGNGFIQENLSKRPLG